MIGLNSALGPVLADKDVCVDRTEVGGAYSRDGVTESTTLQTEKHSLFVCVGTAAAWRLRKAVSLVHLSPSDRWQHYIR